MEESMYVIFDESNPSSIEKVLVDDDAWVENEELHHEEPIVENQSDPPCENKED